MDDGLIMVLANGLDQVVLLEWLRALPSIISSMQLASRIFPFSSKILALQ